MISGSHGKFRSSVCRSLGGLENAQWTVNEIGLLDITDLGPGTGAGKCNRGPDRPWIEFV